MRGFGHRRTVDDALAWVDAQSVRGGAETVPLLEAVGRVLADDVTSQYDVPGFDRAMMDGFAVMAADTAGASAYNRVRLAVTGEVLPGTAVVGRVERGQAVRIMTGGPMPAGADAVLPVELAEIDGTSVYVVGEVPPERNVGRRGEDVRVGMRVLNAMRRLRPQDIGLLASIGMSEVSVVRRPHVRIVTTGNELLRYGSRPEGCRIVDSNGPMLVGLVSRDGGAVTDVRIVPDEPSAIRGAMDEEADVLLVTGGSSVGQEDHAPRLVAEHGELAIHGIAMRPSSPAGMGRWGRKLVFLLPGNPVSCLCAYDFFAGRAIRIAAGRDREWPYRRASLPLGRKLVSVVGRVDYARVVVVDGKVEPVAISGASVLSSTTRADGFVIVPADREGFAPGQDVDVFFYE
jgi:molybdopterin molybdotransferase